MNSDEFGDETKRNLTTTRAQVFGDAKAGTECRICGRNVEDGRSKTCSNYCDNLQTAVMNMLNWSSVRRRIKERDDHTCQECGFDMRKERWARDHIRDIIKEKVGDRPEHPGISDVEEIENFDWDAHNERADEWQEHREELKGRYGDPWKCERRLEVDHITRIADGGHPFDPGNLQTLCEECHGQKTAEENSGRRTPRRPEIEQTLADFAGGALD